MRAVRRFPEREQPHVKPTAWDGPALGWEDAPAAMRRWLRYMVDDSGFTSWGHCSGCGRRLPLPLGNEVLPAHRREGASPLNPRPWCDTVPEVPEWAFEGPGIFALP